MADAETLRRTEVTVRFVSPADRQVHIAITASAAIRRRPNHVALQVGGVVPIMANMSKPRTIEER